jgi:hypothetical protein
MEKRPEKYNPYRNTNSFQISSRLLSRDVKVKIYKTIILPLVLYGCETWSLTSREEHRLRVFENRVLRRILGPKRDEVTGEWRKLHNEGLYNLYCSPIIIRQIKSRRMRWEEHVACVTFRPRFTPWKGPPVPIVQEAGWASDLVWTQRLEEKSFASARDRTPVIQVHGLLYTALREVFRRGHKVVTFVVNYVTSNIRIAKLSRLSRGLYGRNKKRIQNFARRKSKKGIKKDKDKIWMMVCLVV